MFIWGLSSHDNCLWSIFWAFWAKNHLDNWFQLISKSNFEDNVKQQQSACIFRFYFCKSLFHLFFNCRVQSVASNILKYFPPHSRYRDNHRSSCRGIQLGREFSSQLRPLAGSKTLTLSLQTWREENSFSTLWRKGTASFLPRRTNRWEKVK